MKKCITIVTLALCLNTSALDLTEYNNALSMAELVKDHIQVKSRWQWVRGANGFPHRTQVMYLDGPQFALDTFAEYNQAYASLTASVAGTAAGNAFCIGILAALVKKMTGTDIHDKKLLGATALAIIASTWHECQCVDKIPYITGNLQKGVLSANVATIFMAIPALGAALCAYYGIDYALDKMDTYIR